MRFGDSKKQIPQPLPQRVTETVPVVDTKLGLQDELPEYTSQAFSMGRHELGGFALFIISFNPVTGEAKVTETQRIGDSRMAAEDAFKMRVGQFFNEQESKS